MKKSLIEGYKNYWDEYIKYCKTYKFKIILKLGDILRILGYDYNCIKDFVLINNRTQICVGYLFQDTGVYPPDLSERYVRIPIEYLDMLNQFDII